jgi:hypothetical protein
MANGIYAKAKEKFLSGAINLSSDTIKAVLVDSADYTVNLSTHEFLSDVPSGGRVSTSAALSGKSVTGGVFNATSPIVFSAVTGDQCEAMILYKDTGSAATSPLIAYYDTASSGLPVTPNGGDINYTIDSGASKLLSL